MPIYVAIPLNKNIPELDVAVTKHSPPLDAFKLQGDAGWLIKHTGTTIELSNLLQISSDVPGTSIVGPTLVAPISTYYGLGTADMWDWLKSRLEQ